MRSFYGVAALFCFAVLACATPAATPPGPAPEVPLASFSNPAGNGLTATNGTVEIDNRYITGPNTKLYVGDGAIRGTLKFGIPVQVTIHGEQAEGVLGNAPFTCVVGTNADGSAHVTAGTTTFRSTDFNISPTQISGRIAGVTYNMTWTGERYENRVNMGGFTSLSLPAAMASWTNTEVACVLSLLLT
jgi:hypothetical protein